MIAPSTLHHTPPCTNILLLAISLQIFLNQKYGKFGCPYEIEQSHFQELLRETDSESRLLLQTWFVVDNTCAPPVVRLRQINAEIPKYDNSDRKQHGVALEEWQVVRDKIEAIFTAMSTTMPNLQQYLYSGKHCFINLEHALSNSPIFMNR